MLQPQRRRPTSLGAIATAVFLIVGLLTSLPTTGIKLRPASATPPTMTWNADPNLDLTTTGWTKGGTACTNYYQCVNDYPTDTSGTNYVIGPNASNTNNAVTFGTVDAPSDFAGVASVTISAYAMLNRSGDDTMTLAPSVVNSAGTALTTSATASSLTPGWALYTWKVNPSTFDNTAITWNAMRLKFTTTWTQVNTVDATASGEIASARIAITYRQLEGTITQQGYIFENDDGNGSADGNSAQVAGNTAITGVNKGERIDVRTQLKSTTNAEIANAGLFYDRNDGYWTRVRSNATPITSTGTCADNNNFNCTGVDTTGHIDDETSTAVDSSGNPWVSYYDSTSHHLKVAHYVGTGGNCDSTAWQCTTLTNGVTNGEGRFSSIAIDPSNNVWISYWDQQNSKLMVAENVPGTGCAISSWTCTAVQSSVTMSTTLDSTKLMIGSSGFPMIGYHENTSGKALLAVYVGSGGDCTSTAWNGCNTTSDFIDSGVSADTFGIGPTGAVWMVELNSVSGDTAVAQYVGSGGTGCASAAWTCWSVGVAVSQAQFSSIAFAPDGSPWVAWFDSNGDLAVSQYIGSGGTVSGCNGSTAWSCTYVENPAGSIGANPSIAFDPAGHAWVSYQDVTNNDLRLARYVGSSGSGCAAGVTTWTCGKVESANSYGHFSSLAFAPDGTAWIASVDETNFDLRVANLNRGGELTVTSGTAASSNGAAITKSHSDMTAVTDTTDQGDADCSSGTWTNGEAFQSDQGTGINIPSGDCTELMWTISTAQAQDNKTYRLLVAFSDPEPSARAYWRGPLTISQYPTLTTATSTTLRVSKDNMADSSTSCTDTSWACTVIDSAVNAGKANAIAFDPTGKPWIVYEDATNSQLKFAYYVGGTSGSGCSSSAWTCGVLDTTYSNVTANGAATGRLSLKFAPDGTLWASWYDSVNKDLRVAKYVSSGGTGCSSTTWSCTSVDTTGDVGMSASLAIDPLGNPWITYGDNTNFNLKLAKYVGSGGSGCAVTTWTCSVLAADAVSAWGGSNSNPWYDSAIVFDSSGNPVVPFYNITNAGGTNGNLQVARYVGVGGSGCTSAAWACTTVDSTTLTTGRLISAVADASGGVWVSYKDGTNNALKVAQYVGSSGNCTSTAWNCTTVDDQPLYSQIGLDSNGKPWVVSRVSTPSVGRVVEHYVGGTSGNCPESTAWSCTTISNDATNNQAGTIAFDRSATPWVAFYASSSLNVAKLRFSPNQPSYNTQSAPSSGGTTAGSGDLRYELDAGLSPRTGTCGAATDLKGYCGINTFDSSYDKQAALAYETPAYDFAVRSTSNTSFPSYAWTGQSNVATSTSNVVLQVYRFGTTNAWTTVATNSSAAANTNFNLVGVTSAGSASEYWQTDGSNYWTYWRVYQASSSSAETLKTQYFTTATPTFVTGQKASAASGTSSSTITATFPSTTKLGDLIVATVTMDTSSTSTFTCSDGQGNSYSNAVILNDTNHGQAVGLCYATVSTAGASTVTVTYGAASIYRAVMIAEYTGVATSSPKDVTTSHAATATTATDNVTTTSATTTSNNDLVIGGFNEDSCGAVTPSAGTNDTLRNSTALCAATDFSQEDRVSATAGSVAMTETFSVAQDYVAALAAFFPYGGAQTSNHAPNAPTSLAQYKSDGTTAIPSTSRYNFDSTVQGFTENNGGTVSVDSTTKRSGTGSLKAVSNGTQGFWLSDNQGTPRDWSAAGSTFSTWVDVPAAASGSGWFAYITIYDSSGVNHDCSVTSIPTRDTWTLVTCSPASSLAASMEYFVVGVNASGRSGSDTIYVDDVQQGHSVYTNETTVVLKASVSDTDNPDTDSVCVEMKTVGTAFDGSTGITCGAGVATSGSPVTASVTIAGLADVTSYHWRAETKDAGGLTSGWVSYGGNDESTADVIVDQNAPNIPILAQADSAGFHNINTGDWWNETTLRFGSLANDNDASDSLALCVEVKPINTAFTNVDDACGTAVAYSGTAVGPTVNRSGLVSGTQYHWQARVRDVGGFYGSWASYGGNSDGSPPGTPAAVDVGIDTAAPTTGTVYDGSSAGVDAGFNSGSLSSLSCNWSGFADGLSGIASYDYSLGTSAGATDVVGWTNVSSSTTSVTANSLTLRTSQVYYCNVRANDAATNVSSVVSSNGQLVAPSLTFTTSTNAINFAALTASNSYTDTKTLTLTTSTNAYNGYIIDAYETQPLTYGSNTIANYASPASAPTSWSGTGYGYNVSGGASAAAFSGSKYAHFGTAGAQDTPVSHSSTVSGTPISNEAETVTFKVAATSTTPAGAYQTTVVWSCLPSY